ncbi:hypothetical protein [Dactylosporangium salmoneum]|uniref:DUF3014 domain-containing protein n=1 Tax=Dactylosporangium salmoneum TaxID=53361 RepID=A0ABN3HUR0_9ACTN
MVRRLLIAGCVLAAVAAAGGYALWRRAGGGELVTMTRSGGLRGVVQTVSVGDDGGVRVGGRDRDRLPAGRLADLKARLDAAEVDAWPPRLMDDQVRDYYQYDITLRRRTFTTNVPDRLPGLAPVVEALTDLLGQHPT